VQGFGELLVLKLPEGSEAGFRLVDTDEFGYSFTIHLYGKGRRRWYLASRRFPGHDLDTGPLPLRKGEWRTFLNFVKQARFWELPEEHADPPDIIVEGGEWLDVAGREGSRYHCIHRFIWREPGLDQLLTYCRRLSGFFVQHPISGFWIPNLPSAQEAVAPPGVSENQGH
jgi:hypothetical protein